MTNYGIRPMFSLPAYVREAKEKRKQQLENVWKRRKIIYQQYYKKRRKEQLHNVIPNA